MTRTTSTSTPSTPENGAYFLFGDWTTDKGRPVLRFRTPPDWPLRNTDNSILGRGLGVHPTLGPFFSFQHRLRISPGLWEAQDPLTPLDLYDPGLLGFRAYDVESLHYLDRPPKTKGLRGRHAYGVQNLCFPPDLFERSFSRLIRKRFLLPVFLEWWWVGGVGSIRMTVTERIPPLGPKEVPFILPLLSKVPAGMSGHHASLLLPPCFGGSTPLPD